MPYRRLPNTDNARLRALRKALTKGEEVFPADLPFSQATLQRVRYFLPDFEQVVIQKKHACSTHAQRNKEYLQHLKKAKLSQSFHAQSSCLPRRPDLMDGGKRPEWS